MTLKPIESELADLLVKELGRKEFPLNLTFDSPMIDRLPPHVLRVKLQAERNDLAEPSFPETIHGWYYACFKNAEEARYRLPEVPLRPGRPYSLSQFLDTLGPTTLWDFSPLGVVALSRTPLPRFSSQGPHTHTLPLWLNYALSPELWSEHGKWVRFHSRLHKLFSEANLLGGDDFPGYYQLQERGSKLKHQGFLGSEQDHSYTLVLPWSFSLTALKKLEEVIRQEF